MSPLGMDAGVRPLDRVRSPAFLALKTQLVEAVHEEAIKAFRAGERESA